MADTTRDDRQSRSVTQCSNRRPPVTDTGRCRHGIGAGHDRRHERSDTVLTTLSVIGTVLALAVLVLMALSATLPDLWEVFHHGR
ncbi:hypothetical protein SAMN04487820_102397 [Actinopolyspora mzabensis]|uniref:Uncharacterized protein n=1 Tax=Actinopolyspora mzabensis TaxID=995066 RepID=A0A1G8X619_ACTMZ|nr:hypothetical protein SAMN04487820_102397 [Actinopolyspora mzabensis]